MVDMDFEEKVSGDSSWKAHADWEALSAVAALGLLEITTSARDSPQTLAKVIRGSKVLFEGTSSRSLGRVSGTTVIVKDLFHDVSLIISWGLRRAEDVDPGPPSCSLCYRFLARISLQEGRRDVRPRQTRGPLDRLERCGCGWERGCPGKGTERAQRELCCAPRARYS
jgi:hypothetical protein